ncbi:MAG: prepilin-type N-terminal cleavage/methylation domain-containing protein [Oscillospiraceae bacterium]|nr:prepilin-type N-terminal cleavage/methylation domain-containing protein [Oscillospiraceae bacterium]
MFKRLFSKRSGFTLVEIIVAFAVFAIMSTMIVQILNMISLQRVSNNNFARDVDWQEEQIVGNGRDLYDTARVSDGDINLKFDYKGKDIFFDVEYQMNGVDGAYGNNDRDGMAYFVSEIKEPDDSDLDTDPGDPDDDSNNVGSQADRVKLRICGTKGFDYISVNEVKSLGQDSDGNYVYYFDFCADASSMAWDDIPYGQYRIYFYKDGTSETFANIVDAYYVNDGVNVGNYKANTQISMGTAKSSNQDFVVSKCSANGIRVGTPYTFGSGVAGAKTVYKCSACGNTYDYDWQGWSYTCSVTGNTEYYTLAPYTEPRDPNAPYTGNGIRFAPTNHTRIAVAFSIDPNLSITSFGEKYEMSGSECHYKAQETLSNAVEPGFNIYGAYPKN